MRKSVVCHLEGISCGKPCGLPLPCGNHYCVESCHSGQCLKKSTNIIGINAADTTLRKCIQPCKNIRDSCGHPCGANCHEGPCPNSPCNQKVNIKN